jgi:peroxiredoxin/DNA-binding transcriptional MerR regulator
MRIGELALRAGVSIKAVRYYEQLGLVAPARSANGYRDYNGNDLRAVQEICDLASGGIMPSKAGPFIECLNTGHEHSDDCMSSLAAYKDGIDALDQMITSLLDRRNKLARRLERSASRTFRKEVPMTDYSILPSNLPAPVNDGAADHLTGLLMPSLSLQASDGKVIDLAELGPGRTLVYLYPLTGKPGTDLPEGWDSIPGARGCSTEACDFRDHFDQLQRVGVAQVFGLSSQTPEYQREVVNRLRLPFAMLSDERHALADALNLPTFSAPGRGRLYTRLTLVIRDRRIEHVFYPIFPPNTHAQQVLDWLTINPLDQQA